jgi:molecular chaperone DnaK
MGTIVGIELGMSNSRIAVDSGTPVIIRNSQGRSFTPSAIFQVPSGELIVGEGAYQLANAAIEFKRQMGEQTRLPAGGRSFLPEECSALLLRYLLKCFQEVRHEEADRAVITVPAHWKDGPRRATLEAGRLAGIKVERLINEPTAATMAFGARPEHEGKTIIVYDLGGGTFDVTILRIQSRVFDVITSAGDDRLGGRDFDRLLMQYVIEQVASTQKYTHVLGRNKKADHELKLACEEVKRELSIRPDSLVKIPFWNPGGDIGKSVHVEVPIQRSTLESLIGPMVQRSLNYLDEALRRAKLPREAIDDVVMVGGSARIPMIRRKVAERMGREPNPRDLDPAEAIVLGAAIQAGIINREFIDDDSYLILDNVNNDFGIETTAFINGQLVTGVFSPLIPKDTKLPANVTYSYLTEVNDQKTFEVRCFQGNSRWTAQNRFIGMVRVEGLPPRPAGGVSVAITFSLDASETLDVRIQVDDPGIAAACSFNIQPTPTQPTWQNSEIAGKYRVLIEKAEAKLHGPLPALTASRLRAALDRLKREIVDANVEAAELADLAVTDILFDLD